MNKNTPKTSYNDLTYKIGNKHLKLKELSPKQLNITKNILLTKNSLLESEKHVLNGIIYLIDKSASNSLKMALKQFNKDPGILLKRQQNYKNAHKKADIIIIWLNRVTNLNIK